MTMNRRWMQAEIKTREEKKEGQEPTKTYDLVFSTESESVERWDSELGVCPEVLIHSPEAVDAAGFVKNGSILRNHDPNQIVGAPVSVVVDANSGRASASIRFGQTQCAKDAQSDVDNKILRGVSVGYDPLEMTRLNRGTEKTLPSGRIVSGPAVLVSRWAVREVSLTPIPWDVDAGLSGERTRRELNMTEEEKKKLEEAARKAESEKVVAEERAKAKAEAEKAEISKQAIESERVRAKEIRFVFKTAKLSDEDAEKFVDSGKSVEEARKHALTELANASKPPFAEGAKVTADATDKRNRFFIANLGRRVGLQKEYEAELKEVGRGHVSLVGICREWLLNARVAGVDEMSPEEIARTIFNRSIQYRAAANGSADVPALLANVQTKSLMKAYQSAEPSWKQWCRVGSLPDFKIAKRVQLSDFAQLRETGENGEVHESKISDRGENISLATFARRISLTYQMIVNDDLDGLGRLPAMMGRSAAALPSRLVYAALLANGNMADGNALFENTYHGNLTTGSVGALDEEALGIAIAKFRKIGTFAAPNDPEFATESLDIAPRILLVPPDLWLTAKKLVDPSGFAAQTTLAFREILALPVVESRLSNTGYTGYSTTAWYLIGDPAQIDTFEVAFLDGNETPKIETFEEADRLAIVTRCSLSCGVKALDWRGMLKVTGVTV